MKLPETRTRGKGTARMLATGLPRAGEVLLTPYRPAFVGTALLLSCRDGIFIITIMARASVQSR